jgi:hypothetical protein
MRGKRGLWRPTDAELEEELRPLLRDAWLRAADMSQAHVNYLEALMAIDEWMRAGAQGKTKVILPLGYRTVLMYFRRIRPKPEPPEPPLDDLLPPRPKNSRGR